MKVRPDIVRMYREVHGWVGILSGLALFIAFYAGAITMFEDDVQRWATPRTALATVTPIERTPELIAKVLAAHPDAAARYEIALTIDADRPARMSWTTGGRRSHALPRTFHADLTRSGALRVSEREPSQVGILIDILHQQIGLPFPRDVSLKIMGVVALLYVVALVSGTVVLLPSLVSDLYAVRIGRNVKRMWLDVHNVLGLFSLPFHFVMAFSSLVFAYHDQFYDAQGAAFGRGRPPVEHAVEAIGPPLTPAAIVAAMVRQTPGFTPTALGYSNSAAEGLELRVTGLDPRYGVRQRMAGFATVDPYTGRLIDTDYMPGHQDGWSATLTSFFALHFGNFGGTTVRWAYAFLGLAGAALFYTGNLLWVESRRRRERKAGAVVQTRSTQVLAALTVGIPLGCIAGISLTLAAAKPLAGHASLGLHNAVYYTVFVAFVGYALVRGAARSGSELAYAAAVLSLTIPAASILSAGAFGSVAIDVAAAFLAGGLILIGLRARRRSVATPADSVWAYRRK